MTFNLYLVQHGVTEWNVKRWSQGHNDTCLSELGLRQAQLLRKRLAGIHFDAIYSSDLRRAYETVEPLAADKGLQVHREWRLREGRWDRQRVSNDVPILPFPIEHESQEDVRRRLMEFLDTLMSEHAEKSVLLATHGAVIGRYYWQFEKNALWPFPPFEARKGGISHFQFDGVRWECLLLDDDRYAREAGVAAGKLRRKHRHRQIVYGLSQISRRLSPRFLHPVVAPPIKSLLREEPDFLLDPYGKGK